jgi:hypothetical protein
MIGWIRIGRNRGSSRNGVGSPTQLDHEDAGTGEFAEDTRSAPRRRRPPHADPPCVDRCWADRRYRGSPRSERPAEHSGVGTRPLAHLAPPFRDQRALCLPRPTAEHSPRSIKAAHPWAVARANSDAAPIRLGPADPSSAWTDGVGRQRFIQSGSPLRPLDSSASDRTANHNIDPLESPKTRSFSQIRPARAE